MSDLEDIHRRGNALGDTWCTWDLTLTLALALTGRWCKVGGDGKQRVRYIVVTLPLHRKQRVQPSGASSMPRASAPVARHPGTAYY